MLAYIIFTHVCDPTRGKAYTHDKAQLDGNLEETNAGRSTRPRGENGTAVEKQ